MIIIQVISKSFIRYTLSNIETHIRKTKQTY